MRPVSFSMVVLEYWAPGKFSEGGTGVQASSPF